MIYGSVCSGIEAASIAWEPLGWRAAFFSEIEPFPRAVLRHRFPNVPLHGDFTTIQAADYEPIDLLVGGTPCQSFSIAGLRRGLADSRGNLALEYLRLADRLKPRWIVWENVPGVLSSGRGRDFGSFLGGLGELGYGWTYRILDAQYFGVPQRRRRVFVVGHLGDWRRAAAVLFERESLRGDRAPGRKARQEIACDPAGIAGTVSSKWAKGTGGPAGDEHYNLIAHTLRGSGFDAGEHGTGRGIPLVPVAIQERAVCENPNAGPSDAGFRTDGTAFTLEARTVPQAVAFALRGREAGAMPEIHGDGDSVGALRAANGGSSRDYLAFDCKAGGNTSFSIGERAGALRGEGHGGGHAAISGGSVVRRLTPRECERLQGFQDDWTRIPVRHYRERTITLARPRDRWEKDPDGGWWLMAADGPRYKAIGNSMAVPVMHWIGERIATVEALSDA